MWSGLARHNVTALRSASRRILNTRALDEPTWYMLSYTYFLLQYSDISHRHVVAPIA